MSEPNKDAAKIKEAPKKDAQKKDTPKKEAVKRDVPKSNRLEQVKKFLSGAKSELKKVHWPNRQQMVAYTGVVFVTIAIVGAIIWIMDSVLSKGLELLIQVAK
ncbi:MAG: preprotein translocase subunit SecE [Clostridia bacterium]|nr:preprotein translocase subunit SecE [Clostridia bacterium]